MSKAPQNKKILRRFELLYCIYTQYQWIIKIVFQKLPKTYASRKYGMGKLCPCCYFEKSLKVKQLASFRFINFNTNLCHA